MPKYKDISGQRFGKLTAISYYGTDKCGRATWLCKCDCGNEHIGVGAMLRSGEVSSCGCLYRKHNSSNTRLYAIWRSMKGRCSQKNNSNYANYGGRGITVCKEWSGKDGFINFKKWAYENGFDEAKDGNEQSIDRIDVNGNYEPSNCRWATREEQGMNKRTNRILCVDGKEMTITQWAKLSGVNYTVIESRIKAGWELKDAIFLPPKTTCNYKKYYKNEVKNEKL